MKSVIFCVLVASLASEATARSHFHHFHHHIKKNVASKSDHCDQNRLQLQAYKGPLAFEDPNNGKIDVKEALECLETCRCKILGERVDEPMSPHTPALVELNIPFVEHSPSPSLPLSMHETPPQAPPPIDPQSGNFGQQASSSSSSLSSSTYVTPLPSQAPPIDSDGAKTTILLSSAGLPPSPHKTHSAALISSETSIPFDDQHASGPSPAIPVDDDASKENDAHDMSSIDAEFPDGVIDCDEFPRKYGALFLNHRNAGWSGVQRVSPERVDENLRSMLLRDEPIREISTPEPQECKPGCLCSYACPPGYEKSQWPQAQGMNKESLGGLYCHVDNRLYLTKPDVPTLCRRGHGDVTVFNHLDNQAVLCRTDYPGTEGMVIPTVASPGKRIDLTNPNANETYQWQGNPTSAQYYVNPSGLHVEQVCLWKSNDKALVTKVGNWAPIVVGSHSKDGTTWPGIAPNPREVQVGKDVIDNANESLDYSIRITGDLAGAPCQYTKGTKVKDFKGCTTSVKDGEKAVFEFF